MLEVGCEKGLEFYVIIGKLEIISRELEDKMVKARLLSGIGGEFFIKNSN